jgi:hypothetical protein
MYFGVLAAPELVWMGSPARPPAAGGGLVEPLGWVGVAVALGFVLALCVPYRPYTLALRALCTDRVRPPDKVQRPGDVRRADDLHRPGEVHRPREVDQPDEVQRAGEVVPTRLVVGLTLVLAAVGLSMYPRFGSDIFDYAGFERLWVVYGDNPLTGLVTNRPLDWGAALVWYPDRTPAYGPLWALLTWPIIRLAGTSVAAEVAGYKLLSAAAYGLCCWLIWTSVEAPRRQRALVMFAWSPLVLFEVLGKVHNDSLPAVSMLGMVWLVSRGRGIAGMLLVVAGALIKPTALIAAPVLAVSLWRCGGWRRLLPAAIGAALLAAMCYAPFWIGLPTLKAVWQQTTLHGWSPATLLALASAPLLAFASAPLAGQSMVAVRVALGLAWLGVCWLVLARQRSTRPAELAATSGWLVVASVLLLTSAVFAHYFVPAVALAAVADDARLERAVLWLSIGSLAAYGVELLGLTFGTAWLGSVGYQLLGSVVLLGPVSLATLLCGMRRG